MFTVCLPDPGSSLCSLCSVAIKKSFNNIFLGSFFHLLPTSLKIWWDFVVYYWSYTIRHVIIFLNYSSHFTIIVKQYFYYMPNGLASKIHDKIRPHFQRRWRKMKKLSTKKFTYHFWIAIEKIEKRLFPGFSETDIHLNAGNHRWPTRCIKWQDQQRD